MKITLEQILSWGPCRGYDTAAEIVALTDANWPKTPMEIAQLDIPAEDRIWVLLHPEIIPEKRLHLLACDFAEKVLPIFEAAHPKDKRPRAVLEIKRQWVDGKATNGELDAARSAIYGTDGGEVWDASEIAPWRTGWDAARTAVYDAGSLVARTAVMSAAMGAAISAAREGDCGLGRLYQLEMIKRVMK